jgi:hypothetical protein
MPVVVIAEAGNKEIFKYYVEQIPLAIEDLRCIENANNKYIEGRLTLYNGIIFYLYKDKIIKSLSFETLFGTNQMN